jgi:hypothetical protein
MTLAIS